jgi:hypothetical protein
MPHYSLGVVVSANGFGHIRRQLLIVTRLLKKRPELRVAFGVTEAQYKRFFAEFSNFEDRVAVLPGLTDDSPKWRHGASEYSDQNLSGWLRDFKSCEPLVDADFVISDNLVEALSVRDDAWLSGSFLWSDVLETYSPVNASCARFVERERQLLGECRPTMLANKYLATDGVRRRTQLVELGWMIEDSGVLPVHPRELVLIHGGGTRTLDVTVKRIADELRVSGLGVMTDLEGDIERFDYSDEMWARVGLVICRPGVGTVTECVKWQIPMLLLPDQSNTEARHVLGILVADGYASTLENADHISRAELLVRVRESMDVEVEALSRLDRDGLDQATSWIEKRIA